MSGNSKMGPKSQGKAHGEYRVADQVSQTLLKKLFKLLRIPESCSDSNQTRTISLERSGKCQGTFRFREPGYPDIGNTTFESCVCRNRKVVFSFNIFWNWKVD